MATGPVVRHVQGGIDVCRQLQTQPARISIIARARQLPPPRSVQPWHRSQLAPQRMSRGDGQVCAFAQTCTCATVLPAPTAGNKVPMLRTQGLRCPAETLVNGSPVWGHLQTRSTLLNSQRLEKTMGTRLERAGFRPESAGHKVCAPLLVAMDRIRREIFLERTGDASLSFAH